MRIIRRHGGDLAGEDKPLAPCGARAALVRMKAVALIGASPLAQDQRLKDSQAKLALSMQPGYALLTSFSFAGAFKANKRCAT